MISSPWPCRGEATKLALVVCLLLLVVPAEALAQDPRDAEIFGADEEPETSDPQDRSEGKKPAKDDDDWPKPPGGGAGKDRRDQDVFGGDHKSPDLEQKLLNIGNDKLQIGGLLYLRSNLALTDGDKVEDHRLSMPNLLDLYLDARPNDRLRAFVRGRLSYDPTLNEQSAAAQLSGAKQVEVELDELWLKLDIARRVFVTIGMQKVRWGTTRLWNPVDVINSTFRPLLNPFDARHGVPLLKLHLPIESLGWNFYLAGVMEQVDTLDKAGVAGRAEFVFSTVEASLTGAYRNNSDPRLGLDFSAGIWDFDLLGEVGLNFDEELDYELSVQVSVGLQYTMAVFDNDMMIIGAEYFFNQRGTDEVNPMDLYTGKAQYFYIGRHYAGLSVTLPRPGNLDDWTFSLSSVGNLSDRSFIVRFDVSVRVLTYLTIRAYFTGHLGQPGELVLGDAAFPEPDRTVMRAILSPDDPTRPIPAQLFDVGLWMSLDL